MITEISVNYNSEFKSLNEIKELVRSKLDIVDFISQYIKLTPSGKTYKSLCPFHHEKTPSFYVVPHKQIFYCFGCGKGGDVIKFYSEYEKISYSEAITYLSSKLGIAGIDEIRRSFEPKHKLIFYDLLEEVAKLYANQLYLAHIGAQAREYLKKREIDWETAGFFQLGYAPAEGKLLVSKYSSNNELMKNLIKLGLIRKNYDNSYIDVFRNRIVIPIKDIQGRVIGFGARLIEQIQSANHKIGITSSNKTFIKNTANYVSISTNLQVPKYLNSAESEVFAKRKVLYNISNALQEIRHKNQVIVVEGYFDAISLYQSGVKNVVAILGTALTSDQLHQLSRNTENIYLCYDPDEAGQRATLKALSMADNFAVNLKVVKLPNSNEDPDKFIKRESKENFLKLVENAVDFVNYVIDSKLIDKKNNYSLYEKQKIVQDLKPVVAVVSNTILRDEIIKKISQVLDIDYEILNKQFVIKNVEKHKEYNLLHKLLEKNLSQVRIRREEWVIKHLIDDPSKVKAISSILTPSDFSDLKLREVYKVLLEMVQKGQGRVLAAEIIENMPDSILASRIGRLMVSLEDLPPEPLWECVKGMALNRLERESKEILNKIKIAEKANNENEILELQQRLFKIRQNIDKLANNNLIL